MTKELIERLRYEAEWKTCPPSERALWTEAAATIERLDAECEQRISAYKIAFDQAVANGEATAKLVEALARISVRPVKGAKDLNELRFSARQALTAYEGAARHGSE